MKIENTLNEVIRKYPSTCYFVACSGGVDSMVLLNVVRILNLPIHVLHVNYNLRGKDSLDDATFIEDYCKKNNIAHSIHSVHLGDILNENGGNLQNEARKIRYDFFHQKLAEIPESIVLTGQHRNDQIETFWLQLYRGSGMKGMAGMTEERDSIIRPFLLINKLEIIEYALQNKLFWREDISNAKSDYQRNKWRNEYLPELRKTIESIDDSVEFLQKVFQKNLRLIEDKIHFFAEEIKINQVVSDIEINQLQLTELAELFRKLCIPLKMIIPFTKLINSQKGSKIEWFNSEKQKQEIIREDGGYYFNLTTSEKGEPVLTINLVNELPAFFDKNTFYFSPDKIKGNPFLRRWQKGDRIYPIGLAGSKLISDVLTDAKVPNWKRNNQFVLCDEEKILACVGFCIDRRAVTKEEIPILKISITNKT